MKIGPNQPNQFIISQPNAQYNRPQGQIGNTNFQNDSQMLNMIRNKDPTDPKVCSLLYVLMYQIRFQVLQALKQDPETVAKFLRDGRGMQQNQQRNPIGNPQGNNMAGTQMHQSMQNYRGTILS